MIEPAPVREYPVPPLDRLPELAVRLRSWTKLVAWTFGTYQGINRAIGAAEVKDSPAAMHADDLRQQMALLSVIRTFAVLDQSTDASFQAVHRLFKDTGTASLAAAAEQHRREFEKEYAMIDFKALSKLQSFRNTLAHVTWKDVKRFVTYGELEGLVRTACALCHKLNLVTSGLNGNPIEHLTAGCEDAFGFWDLALRADLDSAPPI